MKFFVMDHSGHTTLEFTDEQKAEAQKVFDEFVKEGKTAATRKKGSTDYNVIRDPNKIQDETLFVPRMQGG
jgi:ribosomal protein L10